MANFLLLLASRFAAVVKAYFSRVGGDGGTTVSKQHAQEVYTDTNPYDPTLIQSCDSGKATVLYNIEPNNSDFTVDRNSTKYVLGSGGTIVSYPTDEPAFEFNADGTYKGLLVEPAATNLATYSEDFTGSGWTISAASITGTATGPDGLSNSATEITSANGYFYKEVSGLTSSTTYTYSIWLYSAVGITGLDLWFSDTSFATIGTKESINITAGWNRFSVTVNVGANTTVRLIVGGSGTFPSGAILLAWGAQVETGPIATSYIPTTTASVTRVKDDITQAGAQSLIGQTEGTLYIEVDWREAVGTNQWLLSVNDGTFNNRILIRHTTGSSLNMYATANNVNLFNKGQSSSGYSGIQKIAFAYADSDFELYRNGSSISSDTSGSLAALATLTDIDLGQEYGASNQANMHIRAVALFTRRLSGAELGALTTL